MLKEAINKKGITASFKVLGLCGSSCSEPIGEALASVQNIGNKFGTFDIISDSNTEKIAEAINNAFTAGAYEAERPPEITIKIPGLEGVNIKVPYKDVDNNGKYHYSS